MTSQESILIIGGGQMGFALAKGIGSEHVTLIEPSEERCHQLAAEGFVSHTSLSRLSESYTPSIIILAIKPQSFAASAPDLRDAITRINARAQKLPLLISILAGTPLSQLQSALIQHLPIIRAMPNTPALIRQGISACIATASVSEHHREVASALLSSVGHVVWLTEESQIDAATALSGSGPAYVFYFIESLIEAGVALGLSQDVAQQLALATVKGSTALAEYMDTPLSQLRANVTSPRGTTEAALSLLMDENDGLSPLMKRTLLRARNRARELAGNT